MGKVRLEDELQPLHRKGGLQENKEENKHNRNVPSLFGQQWHSSFHNQERYSVHVYMSVAYNMFFKYIWGDFNAFNQIGRKRYAWRYDCESEMGEGSRNDPGP